MKKKNSSYINLFIFFIMILFSTSASSNYEKIFFDHKITSITGEEINLKQFKNKVILIVNVASFCGFTKQYNELQKLWTMYRDKGLIVIGVPSNSFGQEKDNDDDVKDFCEVNFGITFPMTSIYDVKGKNAHEIYKWAKKNYGISAIPKWNFHKILVNKQGKIEDTFASFTKPTSSKVIQKIEEILNSKS